MVSRLDRFKSAFILILLLAIALRFYDLGLKPVHHDEAVHAWITYYDITLRGPVSYHYDPSYHGPFQYFLNAPIYLFALPDDVIIRVLPAISGVLAVALVYPLRQRIGDNGVLAAAFLMAVSPSMVYQSIFARNDMYIVVFTMLVVIGVLFFIDKRRPAVWERGLLSALTALTFIPIAVFSGFTTALSGILGDVDEISVIAAIPAIVPLIVLMVFTVYYIFMTRRRSAEEGAVINRSEPKKFLARRGTIVMLGLVAAVLVVILLLLIAFLGLTEVQQAALSADASTYLLLLVFVSLLSILVLFEDGREFYLYVAAMALALAFTAKENTVITVIIFTGYIVLWGSDRLLGWSHRLRKVWKPLSDKKPRRFRDGPLGALFDGKRLREAVVPAALTAAVVAAILLFFTLLEIISFSFSNPLDILTTLMFTVFVVSIAALVFYFRNNPGAIRLLFMVTAVFLFIYSLLYSNFYTHPERIGGAFPSMVSHWYEMHSIARIGGPPEFYVSRLLLYETVAFVGGIAAMIHYAQKRNSFMIFCAVWALVSLLGYSYIQEKVPWLIVHTLLPFILLSGCFLGERVPVWMKAARGRGRPGTRKAPKKDKQVPHGPEKGELPFKRTGRAPAVAKLVLLGIGIFFMVWFCILVNYHHPANPAEPMSQVECSWDVRQTVERIDILIQQYEGVNTTEYFIFNGVDYWPFPYYQINFQKVRYCLDADGPGGSPAKDPSMCAQDYGEVFTDANIIITDRSRAGEVDDVLGDEYYRVDMSRYRWCSFSMYHIDGYLSLSWIFWREPVEGTCGSYDISFFYRITQGEAVTEEMLRQAWNNQDYEFWAQLYEARWGYPHTDVQPLTEEFLQMVWDARQYDYYTELYEQFHGEEYTGYIPRW